MIDRLGEHGAAVGAQEFERFGIRRQNAGADAEEETACEQVIDQRHLRRDQQRMAKRQVGDGGTELDRRGVAGERGTEHQARRNVLGEVGQVLAAIAFAVAEPVGQDECFAVFVERLGIMSRRRMDWHDEKAEFHDFLPNSVRRRGADIKVMR